MITNLNVTPINYNQGFRLEADNCLTGDERLKICFAFTRGYQRDEEVIAAIRDLRLFADWLEAHCLEPQGYIHTASPDPQG